MREKQLKRPNLAKWPILVVIFILSLIVAGTLFPASVESRSLFNSPIIIINYTPTPRPAPNFDLTFEPLTLADGLRGHWQLDETDTGDRFDSSTAANTLTNMGGVSWVGNGREGNAADFERDNSQYLQIDSNQAVGLNFYHSFTLMGWLKRESLGDHMMLASKYSFGTGIDDRAYRLQLSPENK